ncbi:MAG: AMP-binding protein, partial [Chloroflexota bacterium]
KNSDKKVINFANMNTDLAEFSAKNIPSTGNALNPLYVLYTSGSTGQAKGVVGHHRGAVNRFSWMWKKYPFSSSEKCAQKTTLNFVDCVWEIFGPLLKGVPLVIVPDQISADVNNLVPFLAKHEITRIVLVPSLLQAILSSFPELRDILPSLKLWTTSGEQLSVGLYKKFSQAYPTAKLLNIYGSSEVAADVTYMDISSYPTNDRMYIGKPIDNMSVYILDDRLEPVPVGIPGEICIAGPGVALGYHNREELTDERFVPNPITGEGKIFLTGDLGRFNADGYIEYLGRRDFQIKIRGIRIEPKEVELALESHKMIAQAQVGEWHGDDDQPDLVAWIVLTEGETESPKISEIRTFLGKLVPNYMIPTKIVSLPEFPLTPNGKTDRQNLPEPTLDLYRLDLPYSPPRDEVEEALSAIWCELLNLHKVSLFDDFFELGGQSMLAVQMFGRVRDHFKINLNLTQLFETPTLIELADIIRSHKDFQGTTSGIKPTFAHASKNDTEADHNHLVNINKGSPDKMHTFYCVHGAGGNVLFFKNWKKYLEDMPFYAFQARGVDGVQMPHESVVEMASAYVNELLKIDPTGPWILGGYSGGGVVALEMALQLEARDFKKPPIIMLDTFHPGVMPRNYTMRDRVHLLTTNPVDYVKSFTQKRLMPHFKKGYSKDELDEMVASGEPLPIELRNDYLSDHFAQSLEQYDQPVVYDGDVLLICAEEIWHMFAHAGHKRGWENTLLKLNVVEVPGDHFSIIEEPLVQDMVRKLVEGVKAYSRKSEVS